jgi:hypothetical protein
MSSDRATYPNRPFSFFIRGDEGRCNDLLMNLEHPNLPSYRNRMFNRLGNGFRERPRCSRSLNVWSRRLESNQRPAVYELLAKTALNLSGMK